MNVIDATDFINDNKGEEIIVRLTDGMTAFGEAFSVNSKGVNIKVDGKTRSIALSKIDGMDLDNLGDDDDDDSDEMTDEDIYAELGEDMTTAELAAHLSDALKTDLTPKELRVHLRALGLGVGKGRKYSLTATEYRLVRDLVTAPAN
jgi:DNA-directed RNA polymerase sigma subunit (sigma70/sigma32)